MADPVSNDTSGAPTPTSTHGAPAPNPETLDALFDALMDLEPDIEVSSESLEEEGDFNRSRAPSPEPSSTPNLSVPDESRIRRRMVDADEFPPSASPFLGVLGVQREDGTVTYIQIESLGSGDRIVGRPIRHSPNSSSLEKNETDRER